MTDEQFDKLNREIFHIFLAVVGMGVLNAAIVIIAINAILGKLR